MTLWKQWVKGSIMRLKLVTWRVTVVRYLDAFLVLFAVFFAGFLSSPNWTINGVRDFMKLTGVSIVAANIAVAVLSAIVLIF
jgi:hypothetical protein